MTMNTLGMLPSARQIALLVAEKAGATWLRAYAGEIPNEVVFQIEIDHLNYQKNLSNTDLKMPLHSANKILDELLFSESA